jgi:pilus assembly protein CpaC
MAHEPEPGVPGARRTDSVGPARAEGARPGAVRWALPAFLGIALAVLTVRGQDPEPDADTGPAVKAVAKLQPPRPDAAAQPPAPGPNDQLPPPRRLEPLGPGHPRLERLPPGMKGPVGTTPRETKEAREKFKNLVGPVIDPELSFEVVVGRPRLLPMKERPFRVQVGDDQILSYTLITDRDLSIQGNRVGTTVLNLWFGDENDRAKQTVLSLLVNVLPDPEIKERLERIYKALEEEINRAFPDSYVCLFLVGDKLVVTGQAKDVAEESKIIQIITTNTPATPGSTIPVQQVNLNLDARQLGPEGLPRSGLEQFLVGGGNTNIVNLMRIPGEQQVMLKVTVAEINRSAARSIGLNFQVNSSTGVVFAQNTGPVMPNILARIGRPPDTVNLQIEALRNINMARTLAEPNLTTLNGQPAVFFAGGEFPVPVVTGAGIANTLQGVTFVPFGVQLQFVPFITDKDRIRINVNASVSVRTDQLNNPNANTGATIGSAGGTVVPGLNTRNVSTTVELREGQTFAIGGLLQTNLGAQTSRVPLFGDLPIIGNLFRVSRTQSGEQELVLLVTPQLVHPMEPHEIPPLPGSDYFEPGDLEFYLRGQLESYRAYDYRSQVQHDINRMAAYRHCELLYFVGPHGHSDAKP